MLKKDTDMWRLWVGSRFQKENVTAFRILFHMLLLLLSPHHLEVSVRCLQDWIFVPLILKFCEMPIFRIISFDFSGRLTHLSVLFSSYENLNNDQTYNLQYLRIA